MSSTELPETIAAAVAPKVSPIRAAAGERFSSVELPGLTLNVRSRPATRDGVPPALYVHGLGAPRGTGRR